MSTGYYGDNVGREWHPHRLAVYSTSLVGSFACSTVAFVPGDISSESAATITPPVAHARCPYCGTARKPWTYANCINCGAPA